MEQTIYDNTGEKYITMIYDEERGIIKMRIHRYDPEVIYLNFDRKAIPEMMSFLELVKSK
jgi:hypothetical protein